MSAGAIVARREDVMVPLGELESDIATRIAPPSALLELELDEPTALASAVAERGARSAAACSVMRVAAALAAARFGIAIPRTPDVCPRQISFKSSKFRELHCFASGKVQRK